jgi:hypothetical protein
VVEQRLPGNHEVKVLRRARGLEDSHHRNGIRGRDQRSEQQAVDQGQFKPHPRQREPGSVADRQCGQHSGQHSQHADLPAVRPQLAQIHVQGTGKEQQREHALHQDIREVDRTQQRLLVPPEPEVDARSVHADQRQ